MGNDANTVGKELKYAAAGAGVGAAIGSVVPGVGTAVGAGVGAVAGSLVGLFSGGPDAEHAEANVGGRSIDARAIWEKISPGNTGSLDEGSGAAKALQDVHAARARQIDALNKTMDAAWQGNGASAAQAGAHPLGIWLDSSANNLQQSHTYLTNQADSFHTVKGKVQEIAKDPPSAGFMDGINPFSDKDDEINQYNEQGKTNVAAFNAYYQASAQNAAGMPQYQAWQGNNISDPGGGGQFGGGGGNFGGGGGGSFGGGGAGAGSFTPPKTGTPRFDATPPRTTPPGGRPVPPGVPGPGPGAGRFGDGTSAAGYLPPDTSTSGFGPGRSGFGPGGGGGFGPSGGSAGGAEAGGFGGGFGPGGGALSGAAEAGAGTRGAGGAGGLAGGRPGASGSSGMGGMGHGAGKGAKGGEDEEHASKYLVAEDPNELFGTDALTVPPVIGE